MTSMMMIMKVVMFMNSAASEDGRAPHPFQTEQVRTGFRGDRVPCQGFSRSDHGKNLNNVLFILVPMEPPGP